MKFSFRGTMMMSEWGITDDDCLLVKGKQYPLSEIKSIRNIAPPMPLTNGTMTIATKDGKVYVLAYSRSQRALADECYRYITANIGIKEYRKKELMLEDIWVDENMKKGKDQM